MKSKIKLPPLTSLASLVPPPPPQEENSSLWEQLREHPDYQGLHAPCAFSTGVLGLRSPLNLPDIEKAVAYLQEALDQERSICVVGDRDVDGVSSTALLGSFLKERHKGRLELIVSDEGDDYGLSGAVLARVQAMPKQTLVILLDMGTSHGPEIESLVKEGKQVIVLDHHQVHERPPNPALCAFVNPQRNREEHLHSHQGKIATVGLVFKALFALALSHIQDWRRIYFIEINGLWHAFRCGFDLGGFSSIEDWRAEEERSASKKENFSSTRTAWISVVLTEPKGGEYSFSKAEWDKLKHDADHAGQLLLAKIVEARPRLRAFIQSIADLAALGTLTDMVPLVDENRTLVRIGLGQALFDIEPGRRPYRMGYAALGKALGVDLGCVLSHDLSWLLGPAVNAGGRMGNTRLALDLLLCTEEKEAQELAHKLVNLNESRKRRTRRNEEIVCQYLAQNQEKLEEPVLFCYHPELKPGVSGIIATRLTEQYQKPVVYINNDGAHARGSVRTWNGLNVLELLDTAAPLFIQFGGHPEASGFSIAYDNISVLEQTLQKGYHRLIKENEKQAKQQTDDHTYHIECGPEDLHHGQLEQLTHLEPFGSCNPEPIFRLTNVRPFRPRYMRDGLHVSFQILKTPRSLIFVAWRKGVQIKKAIENNVALNLYGSLEMANFRGYRKFQFRVEGVEEVKEVKEKLLICCKHNAIACLKQERLAQKMP